MKKADELKVKEAVEDLDAGASYEDINQQLDAAKYESFCQQLNKLVNNNDPKTQALYDTFKQGWKDEYDGVTVDNEFVSIRDLHPTQNVIFANKSLVPMLNGTWTVGGDKDGKGGKSAVEVVMSGGGVQIPLGSPLVVCNVGGVNYLIDGHHRWSKFYAFNPTCKLQSWVIRNESGKGIFRSADDVLKFAQGTLAALGQDTVVQQSKTDVNMYDLASGGEDAGFNWMLNTVNKNITPQVLQTVINSNLGKRNGIKDNTTLAHYLWQNLDTVMFEAAPAGVHGREYMPQYPSGVNPEQAVDMISENTKFTLTIKQLRRLVKEATVNEEEMVPCKGILFTRICVDPGDAENAYYPGSVFAPYQEIEWWGDMGLHSWKDIARLPRYDECNEDLLEYLHDRIGMKVYYYRCSLDVDGKCPADIAAEIPWDDEA